MSTLYDSDNPDSIPSGVNAAGYVDGYAAAAWNARGWARFPSAIRIAVFAANDGDALDVETGDATPDQAPIWVKRQNSRGITPWVYVNRANGAAVEAALLAAGLQTSQVYLWIATLDGTKTVTNWNNGVAVHYPVAAVQYANSAASGGHYDLSEVYIMFGVKPNVLGGTENMFLEPPFKVNIHAGTHWYGTAAGQDMGVATAGVHDVDAVSSDGQWYRYSGSTWWVPASGVGVLLPSATTVVGPQGIQGLPGKDGLPGPQGLKGDPGAPGKDGQSFIDWLRGLILNK